MTPSPQLRASVVICADTPERWDDLVRAVRSVERERPYELIVVIDHHEGLLRHAQTQFAAHRVLPSQGPRGLSGARNTGLWSATGDITVFLDDDAQARPGWLSALLLPYGEARVLGVGGLILPDWVGSDGEPAPAPRWFPPEFLWVVGCSYRGLPARPAPVRNLIGANMSGRSAVLREAGGFRSGLGRIGKVPLGGEETELCLRVSERYPDGVWWYEPAAVVDHRVPPERATWDYLARRCYAEGLSKARIAALRGRGPALSAEGGHLRRLPAAAARAALSGLQGDPDGLTRAGVIVAGVAAAGVGYLRGFAQRGLLPESLTLSREEQGRPAGSPHLPVLVRDLELGAPLPRLSRPRSDVTRARLTVHLHGQPLGLAWVDLPEGELGPNALAEAVWEQVQTEISAHVNADGLPPTLTLTGAGLASPPTPACREAWRSLEPHAPPFSVVVATRGRPERMAPLLGHLLALDYPTFEVVIVDNAPPDERTREAVEAQAARDPRVRYVREPRPGLSAARNTGVRHARYDVLAVTDDDVTPDSRWLQELALGFTQGKRVGCVTGGILARELDTPAQHLIEEYGGFHKGFSPQLYDLGAHRRSDALYPFAAGRFGSGANIALRRKTWQDVGGFEEALGAGTPGLGGEDLALFTDVLFAGWQLAYRPGALVYHEHHRGMDTLRRQMGSYGAGLSAYLTRVILRHPARLPALLRRVPAGLWHALAAGSAKNRGKSRAFPPELTALERRGMLRGPAAYLRGVRALRRG